MSVIICLVTTQRLMQSGSATLTQLAEGEFLDDERKELTKMCSPLSGCGQEYFQILCNVELYGLLLNAPPSKSRNRTVSTMLYAALSNRDTYHYRGIT